MYANACCPKVVLTMGRLTRVLSVCCGGGWGDRRGMKDRKERVIYDICKSTQQDEVSYDTEVKRDQVRSVQSVKLG